jgi:phosphatidylserine/phosphatidylglycerophosphate/cardiolipin synthase-like enzyme
MKPKTNHLWALIILFLGILIGAGAYELGIERACPTKTCVSSAEITPVTDRGYFDEAHKILSEAKTSIHIVSFEMKYYKNQPNSKENILVRDLIYAKERGLDVKIVQDEFSEQDNAYDMLKGKGLNIRYDTNETTTHAKLIIVDGKIVLIGSTNLSYFALERNNEANVLIKDEKTAQTLEKYFQNIWDTQT